MSNWTYISGSCDIERSALEAKVNKDGTYKRIKSGEWEGHVDCYRPYLEEQTKLLPPEIFTKEVKMKLLNGKYRIDEHHPFFAFKVQTTSYPIVKRLVDNLMKQMPHGENKCIEYTLTPVTWPRQGGNFDNRDKVAVKYIHELIMDQFPSYTRDWKEYNRYKEYEIWDEDMILDSYLSIQSDLRDVDAKTLYEKLIWLFGEMAKRDITFNTGCFAWHDAYNIRYTMYIEGDEFTVEKYDIEKDTIERDYYQIFCYSYEDRDVTYELKKVDKFTDDHWIEENN